jgi:mRNA interferase YafQ
MSKYKIHQRSQFKRDLKICAKRGYDMTLLGAVMKKLQNGEPLDPAVNRPHPLNGTNPVHIECHIKTDWLLIYRIFGDELIFIRTGTHSDLF